MNIITGFKRLLANKKLVLLKEYFLMTLGSFITAAAINVFLIPHKIVPGGLSGVATVIHYLSKGVLPVGVTMIILNIPLFIGGIALIGRRFIIRTIFSSAIFSIFIDYTQAISSYFIENFLLKIESMPTQPDLLLYSIFGGLMMGVGLGLVFKYDATTGGSDLIARMVNHFVPFLTMGQILLFVDVAVVVMAAIVFQSFLLALYAVVSLFITSKVIDVMLEGVSFARAVFIISDNSEKIAEEVLKKLDRGVTSLKGTGMYTKSDKEVLLCVLHRRQIPVLKQLVKKIDVKAFVILADVREVLGEGFNSYE